MRLTDRTSAALFIGVLLGGTLGYGVEHWRHTRAPQVAVATADTPSTGSRAAPVAVDPGGNTDLVASGNTLTWSTSTTAGPPHTATLSVRENKIAYVIAGKSVDREVFYLWLAAYMLEQATPGRAVK